jgi:hypothetical protein
MSSLYQQHITTLIFPGIQLEEVGEKPTIQKNFLIFVSMLAVMILLGVDSTTEGGVFRFYTSRRITMKTALDAMLQHRYGTIGHDLDRGTSPHDAMAMAAAMLFAINHKSYAQYVWLHHPERMDRDKFARAWMPVANGWGLLTLSVNRPIDRVIIHDFFAGEFFTGQVRKSSPGLSSTPPRYSGEGDYRYFLLIGHPGSPPQEVVERLQSDGYEIINPRPPEY